MNEQFRERFAKALYESQYTGFDWRKPLDPPKFHLWFVRFIAAGEAIPVRASSQHWSVPDRRTVRAARRWYREAAAIAPASSALAKYVAENGPTRKRCFAVMRWLDRLDAIWLGERIDTIFDEVLMARAS